VLLSAILSVVTLGLYAIYWHIALTSEVGRLSENRNFNGFKQILLILITCNFWSLIWSYQLGKNLARAQDLANARVSDYSLLFLILSLLIYAFGLLNWFAILVIAQHEVNKLVLHQ